MSVEKAKSIFVLISSLDFLKPSDACGLDYRVLRVEICM